MKHTKITLLIIIAIFNVIQGATQTITGITEEEQKRAIVLFNHITLTYNLWIEKINRYIPQEYKEKYFTVNGVMVKKITAIDPFYSKNITRRMHTAIKEVTIKINAVNKDASHAVIKHILKKETLIKDLGIVVTNFNALITFMRTMIIKNN